MPSPEERHAVQDENLKVLVNEAHTVEGRTYYGSPRVHRSLKKQGVPVSRKRIVRIPRNPITRSAR